MAALQVLLPPLVLGLAMSLLAELALTPQPLPVWRRSWPCLALHVGSCLLLFGLDLLLFRRPWFALATLLALQLLLLLVHYAKYYNLRESFIFQDFEYFTDAIKHPRLYLPFFGIARTVAATIGFVAAFAVGLLLETPLAYPAAFAASAILALSGLALAGSSLRRCPEVSFDPDADLRKLGQVAFFWAYWRAERETAIGDAPTPFAALPPLPAPPPGKQQPHIVAVQCESFFDPRPLYPGIKASVLEHFDHAKTQAERHGRLHVPAWGANTVRSECAFLTGVPPEGLGVHRFNPYRALAKQAIPNLAAHLKRNGYHTVCIHPYPASFYLRDKVFPLLGFDRFIDIKDFATGQKCGQYIGDLAAAEKVAGLLQDGGEQPLFIFVITMENHGPLHLEQPGPDDITVYYEQPPPPGCEDLGVYLRHLRNADLMIKHLADSLNAHGRGGVLCWYGDHVPIMPKVYGQFGTPAGHTEYFIWRTPALYDKAMAPAQAIAAHDLAMSLLAALAMA